MANIVTGFFRLYAKKDWQQAHLSRQRLLKTLDEGWGGRSYWVPNWSRRVTPRIIELQSGFRNSLYGDAERVWTRFGEHLEAIWVRFIDPGSPPDEIYGLTHEECSGGVSRYEEESFWGACRYVCDRIEIHWSPQAPPHLQIQRTFFVKYIYLGQNARQFGWQEQGLPPLLRTLTTPTRFSLAMHWFAWDRLNKDTLPPELLALESDIGTFATRVEFFWQKRLVHLCLPWKGKWLRYYADDWDNCVDEPWLHWKHAHPEC